MALPGRPRKHDSIADKIGRMIKLETPPDEVSALITTAGVDILDGGAWTPLIHSAFVGNKVLVEWLITKGASIDHQDRNGWSALHYGVQEKHIGVVECLLNSGASPALKDIHGNTPLWRAVFDARGSYNIVKLLLSKGADPYCKNKANQSPLDFAMQINDQQLIQILENAKTK